MLRKVAMNFQNDARKFAFPICLFTERRAIYRNVRPGVVFLYRRCVTSSVNNQPSSHEYPVDVFVFGEITTASG